jgi:hypothetical protein
MGPIGYPEISVTINQRWVTEERRSLFFIIYGLPLLFTSISILLISASFLSPSSSSTIHVLSTSTSTTSSAPHIDFLLVLKLLTLLETSIGGDENLIFITEIFCHLNICATGYRRSKSYLNRAIVCLGIDSYYHVAHAVAQLVGALRYKPERRGFDSRW